MPKKLSKKVLEVINLERTLEFKAKEYKILDKLSFGLPEKKFSIRKLQKESKAEKHRRLAGTKYGELMVAKSQFQNAFKKLNTKEIEQYAELKYGKPAGALDD